MFNLKEKLAEALSSYIEFDPKHLELAIWRGDLSLSNVTLKADAINPLLSDLVAVAAGDDLNTPPQPTPGELSDENLSVQQSSLKQQLQLKLIKSEIGHLGFEIPWTRLVWGSSDVQLSLSNITLVLSLDPDEDEPTAQNGQTEQQYDKNNSSANTDKLETVKEEGGGGESSVDDGNINDTERSKERKRDEKQKLLSKAERLQLQGLPLPSNFTTASGELGKQRKNSLLHEGEPQQNERKSSSTTNEKLGMIQRYLKFAQESLIWRCFAGLHASIRNIRIVLVQNGVEVGVILHSFDIGDDKPPPTKKISKNKKTILEKKKDDVTPEETTEEENPASSEGTTTDYDDEDEDEIDVGERQVDKRIQIGGLGVFVRNETVQEDEEDIPKELYFSTSVTADDYVLRPTQADLTVSIYEPPLPGTAVTTGDSSSLSNAASKRRDRKKEKRVKVKRVKINTATNVSISEETISSTASSINRRNKRDRHRIGDEKSISSEPALPAKLQRAATNDAIIAKDQQPVPISKRSISDGTDFTTPTVMTAASSTPSFGSNVGKPKISKLQPHFSLQLQLEDIKLVCSSNHYYLTNMFCINLIKTRNGRPTQTISSVITNEDGAPINRRAITIVAPSEYHETTTNTYGKFTGSGTMGASSMEDSPKIAQNSMLPPPEAIARGISEPAGSNSITNSDGTRLLRLELLKPAVRSKRSIVIRSWWQYAYNAVIYELRNRNKQKHRFNPSLRKFDWTKQRYKRKEYITTYIAVRLENHAFHERLSRTSSIITGEEELLQIEDVLPIEQILLYRSIARALRVRGQKVMPDSLPPSLHRETKSLNTNLNPYQSFDRTNYSPTKETSSSVGTVPIDNTKSKAVGGKKDFVSSIRQEAEGRRKRRQGGHTEEDKLQSAPDDPAEGNPAAFKSGCDDISTEGTRRTSVAGSKHVSSDMHTVRSFKTAKSKEMTAATPVKKHDTLPQDSTIFSFSLTCKNIELMVYETDRHHESIDIKLPRQKSSNDPHEITDDPSGHYYGARADFDDISDLSEPSDTNLFLDNDDQFSVNPEEDDGRFENNNILSSADFLFFGTPASILSLVVSSVDFYLNTDSIDSSNYYSLSVGSIEVTGHGAKNSIISSGLVKSVDSDYVERPINEVNIDGHLPLPGRDGKASKIPVCSQNKAVEASIVEVGGGTYTECDLSKITVTLDLDTSMKLLEFSSIDVSYPQPLLEPTGIDDVRKYVMKNFVGPQSRGTTGNCAIRVHGVEIIIPQDLMENTSDSRTSNSDIVFAGSQSTATTSSYSRDSVHLSIERIEYYTGSVVDYYNLVASQEGSDEVLSQSYFTAVRSIGKSNIPLQQTRKSFLQQLTMLDIGKTLAKHHQYFNGSHDVVTFGGLDCVVLGPSITIDDARPSSLSLLEKPLDIELLHSGMTFGELGDDSPKHQLTAHISPALFVLSEARLGILLKVMKSLSNYDFPSSGEEAPPPQQPRIAVLSSNIVHAVDIAVSRIKFSVITDAAVTHNASTLPEKQIIMAESIRDYLSFVACFHVQFPTEESMTSARQIGIDRLITLGLTEKESQNCFEAARLNFLVDMEYEKAQSRAVRDDESGSEMSDDGSTDSVNVIEIAIGYAIKRAMDSFIPLLEDRHLEKNQNQEILVIDLFHGANVTMVKLYYDFYVSFQISSLAIRNGSGITLLKIGSSGVSPNDNSKEGHPDKHVSFADPAERFNPSNSAGSEIQEKPMSEETTTELASAALSFSLFALDESYLFGSGGLPVKVLGAHDNFPETDIIRIRESIFDVAIGDIDLLFSQRVIADLLQKLLKLIDIPSSSESGGAEKNTTTPDSAKQVKVKATNCGHISRLSILIATDELIPFSRCTLETLTASKEDLSSGEEKFFFNAEFLSLINLTPEGQTFHEIISPLAPKDEAAGTVKPALSFEFVQSPQKWEKGPEFTLTLSSTRFVFVYQYVQELLQYFTSAEYGIGLLLSELPQLNSDATPDIDVNGNPPPPLQFQIKLLDASIIIPRSSVRSEFLAIEAKGITVFNDYQVSSWKMPSEKALLMRGQKAVAKNESSESKKRKNQRDNVYASTAEFHDCVDNLGDGSTLPNMKDDISTNFINGGSQEESNYDKEWFSRTTIRLQGAYLFTAMARSLSGADDDNIMFNKYFRANGKVESGQDVFTSQLKEDTLATSTEEDWEVSNGSVQEKRRRKWENLTENAVSIDIIVDFAPHLRVLITDSDNKLSDSSQHIPKAGLRLNMRMSQFYLILSVYYDNMKELPVMFPFSESQIIGTSPSPPSDFPEYGTESYVTWLKDTSAVNSEIACVFKELSICCSYDKHGYFDQDPKNLFLMLPSEHNTCSSGKAPLQLLCNDFTLHYAGDQYGIIRLSCGASSVKLKDKRQLSTFEDFLLIEFKKKGDSPSDAKHSWADLQWGLDCDGSTFGNDMPQPFQVSVFMTPGWVLVNLGIGMADAVMFDISPIFILLEYFAGYFSEPQFGNPDLETTPTLVRQDDESNSADELKIDFRLWLMHPYLVIPSNNVDLVAQCVRIESKSGLWFRYKSLGPYASQEVCSPDLSMCVSECFTHPRTCRGKWGYAGVGTGIKTLVEDLSFNLRYDVNSQSNHTSLHLQMPFVADNSDVCAVTSPELNVSPMILPDPVVCTPIVRPTRYLSSTICEATLHFDILPMVSSLIMKLAGPTEESNVDTSAVDDNRSNKTTDPESENEVGSSMTFDVSANIGGVRFFVLDPVLGRHLPVAVVSVSKISLTASQFGEDSSVSHIKSQLPNQSEAPTEDLQVTMTCHFWADYFKLGVTRSWEPLLEPYECCILFEKSRNRGQGLSLSSDSSFHLNVTSALLVTIDEVINTINRAVSETFGDSSNQNEKPPQLSARIAANEAVSVKESDSREGSQLKAIRHEIPKSLGIDDRVAFSFRNLTGQKIRIHQHRGSKGEDKSSKVVLTYLDHTGKAILVFDATMSVLRNLEVVEVEFPGLPDSHGENRADPMKEHAVDVHIPGFRWLQGIAVDTSGRWFDDLIPRSDVVRSKIKQDWRLQNALKLLTEVGLENGGRLVTARSSFEVRNNTSHSISLSLHPNPSHDPVASGGSASRNPDENYNNKVETDVDSERLEPGKAFQIPLLLLESSLQLAGNHLGSFWLRPDETKECPELRDTLIHGGDEVRTCVDSTTEVGFCSRPIQLAKVVQESAFIYRDNYGEDVPSDRAKSGLQVSCPISEGAGVSVAPFCYIVEIQRSPLVRYKEERKPGTKANGPLKRLASFQVKERQSIARKTKRSQVTSARYIHGPVSYSLVINPPIVIENLLPEEGRFELMHATRRTVLWFKDLKPGERVPVHSVGLDSPLFLLVNFGFCRTPVGEGALVHHGSNRPGGLASQQHAGIKTIGRAVSKGTKQIGKTITAISDSADKRGQGRLLEAQNVKNPGGYNRHVSHRPIKTQGNKLGKSLGVETGFTSGDNTRGKVHTVESYFFMPEDVVSETSVVDSVGQRLTLKIENIRGGGGQRRISLFCPFWIINTTEHSLRYKQENTKAFVSGTVISPSQDGSKPVDGSNRNYVVRHSKSMSSRNSLKTSYNMLNADRGTVFAGTPGALASSPGECNLNVRKLSKLLDKDLPLNCLTEMAFMFNFHEDVLSIGHDKLSVQLGDATSQYTSDWSAGFSLDSVGVTQIVGMQCKEGRSLEVSMTITVAPGALSAYTKIVRFTPRYVLVNHLERPIRLWQDCSFFRNEESVVESDSRIQHRKWFAAEEDASVDKINRYESLFGRPAVLDEVEVGGSPMGTTAHPSALYIATAESGISVPFHLPDTRGERQLRVDLGYPWNLTSSISSDIPGEYTLNATKSVDLRLIRHVSTRAAPQYNVVLPPPMEGMKTCGVWDGELGVWFETDWGSERRIIVKGTKRGRYSFNHTDIHVGDELLFIDGIAVSNMDFSAVMKLLKAKLSAATLKMQEDGNQESSGLTFSRRGLRRAPKNSSFASKDKHTNALSTDTRTFRVVLTFRTVEEHLRRVRVKAAKRNKEVSMAISASRAPQESTSAEPNATNQQDGGDSELSRANQSNHSSDNLKVDMSVMHHSTFLFVRPQDPENPPFRVENRAMNHLIYYRQQNCDWHPWKYLKPGESRVYTWEEPMRPRKLSVRVGMNIVSLFGRGDDGAEDEESQRSSSERDVNAARATRARQLLSFQYIDNEELGGFGPTKQVMLEEIGFTEFLPCPGASDKPMNVLSNGNKCLYCHVDTDASTRVLVVSDFIEGTGEGDFSIMYGHLSTLQRQILEEKRKIEELEDLNLFLQQHSDSPQDAGSTAVGETKTEEGVSSPCSTDLRRSSEEIYTMTERETETNVEIYPSSIEVHARELADLPDPDAAITSRHQVIVQVLEASGLKPSDFSGICNPYCELSLKGRSKSTGILFRKKIETRKTYYIEKTLSPKWSDQIFVFNVPAEAVEVTRGHSVRIQIRNFRTIGQHPYLGQTSVHFRSLRSQKELEGWYPLVGRTGHRELVQESANWGRGSVKLRVQWIYTVSGLVEYFLMLSERRLGELQLSRQGMQQQLEKAIESDNHRKELKDPFGAMRMPNVLGMTGEKLRSMVRDDDEDATLKRGPKFMLRRMSRKGFRKSDNSYDADSTPLRRGSGGRKPSFSRQTWIMQSGPEGMKEQIGKFNRANEKYIGWLRSQITDSLDKSNEKKAGVQETHDGSIAIQVARERLESIEEFPATPGRSEADESASRRRILYGSPLVSFGSTNSSEPSNIIQTRMGAVEENVTLQDGGQRDGEICVRTNGGSEADTRAGLYNHCYFHSTNGSYFHRRHLSNHIQNARATGRNSTPTLWFREKLELGVSPAFHGSKLLSSEHPSPLLVVNNQEEKKIALGKAASDITLDDIEESQVDAVKGTLLIPPFAPSLMLLRSLSRANEVVLSRNKFEKTCRRHLKSVLNPGGWLTIRPITALNLPDTYTGMSVKVRYGSSVITSKTADAKVTPTWSDLPVAGERQGGEEEEVEGGHTRKIGRFQTKRQVVENSFENDVNDLPVYVEPLQTSGSLRVSVVGERLKKKIELGVLHIPLGPAISCCIEQMDDNDIDDTSSTPMYVRWFPLMSPKDSVPTEGDMGLSLRPTETEKLSDNMFSQYFAPCIKLAIIWQPDNRHSESIYDERKPGSPTSLKESLVVNDDDCGKVTLTKTYFNADIGRITAGLVDSQRALELLSFSFSDIDLRYSVTKTKTRSSLAVGWVQIDHQDENTRESVILAPTPVAHPHPTLQFLAVKDNIRSKSNVDSYEYVAMAMQELDLSIEEIWIFDLWDFLIGVIRRKEATKTESQRNAGQERQTFSPRSSAFDRRSSVNPDSLENSQKNDFPHLLSLLEPKEKVPSEQSDGRKVYVERLFLGSLKLNLTYLKGGKKGEWETTESGAWSVKNATAGIAGMKDKFAAGKLSRRRSRFSNTESEAFNKWSQHTHDEDLWEGETKDKAEYNFPKAIAAAFPSISDARIRLHGKEIVHVFESSTEIAASVHGYYRQELLRQIYKIIGSLDFVGNPTMVFNSFVTGVRDFIITPSQEFMQNPNRPSRLGIGVAKGTLSLFSHSFSGLCGFAARLSASAGQIAATFSLDENYKQWHMDTVVTQAKTLDRRWKTRGMQSVGAMITKPIEDIALGIVTGVAGVFISPYVGARRRGCKGFGKGVVQGTVGIFIKPIVGVFDAFSHFTGSVHDIARSVNVLEKRYQPSRRLRFPYFFSLEHVLVPFDPIAARSVYLLGKFPMKIRREVSGFSSSGEVHVASEVLQMEPGVETYVVVTSKRVVLFKVRSESNGTLASIKCGELDLACGAAVTSAVQDEGHNGVALTIITRYDQPDDIFLPKDPEVSLAKRKVGRVSNQPLPSNDESDSGLGAPLNVKTFLDDLLNYEDDNIREWLRVVGEFQHRRQLTRLHNAICCITDNGDDVIHERGLAPEGSLEGQTVFGPMTFGVPLISNVSMGYDSQTFDEFYAALEGVPWINAVRNEQSKETWLFSDELEASAREGGPSWLVTARARAMWIPLRPPQIPDHIPLDDEVIVDVFSQLDQGNISYEQACKLVASHEKSLADDEPSLQHGEYAEEDFRTSAKMDYSSSAFFHSKDGEDSHTTPEYLLSSIDEMTFDEEAPQISLPTQRGLVLGSTQISEREKAMDPMLGANERGTDLSPKLGKNIDDSGDDIYHSIKEAKLLLEKVTGNEKEEPQSSVDNRLDKVETMLEKLLWLNTTDTIQNRNEEIVGLKNKMKEEESPFRNDTVPVGKGTAKHAILETEEKNEVKQKQLKKHHGQKGVIKKTKLTNELDREFEALRRQLSRSSGTKETQKVRKEVKRHGY